MVKKKARRTKSAEELVFERRLRLKEYVKERIEGTYSDVVTVKRTFREWVSGLDFTYEEVAYIIDHYSVGDNFLFVRWVDEKTAVSIKWVCRLNTLTLEDLETRAREYARLFWGREFDIPIVVVDRYWKRWYGVYIVEYGKPVSITFSQKRMYGMTESMVYDTLLHELVHWHLHTSGRPFDDRDEEFILECRRVGATLSGSKYARDAAKRVDGYK